MALYFDQLKERLGSDPSESRLEILDLVRKVESGYSELSQKLLATEFELNVTKQSSSGLSDAERELENLRKKLEDAVEQKTRHFDVIASQQREIDRLDGETRHLNGLLDAAQIARNEAISKVMELESTKFSTEYQLSQLQMEVEQLNQKSSWAYEQLELRNSELESLRRDTAIKLGSLESELNAKRSDLEVAEQVRQSFSKSQQDLQQQLADLTAKLHESTVNFATMEQRYTAELKAAEKRDCLYREQAEDNQRRFSDVSARLAEFEALVQQKDGRIIQILGEVDKLKGEAQKIQSERDSKIQSLQRELENANNLLSAAKRMGIPMDDKDVEPLSPAAVVAGRLMKSGLTITQMYTNYLEMSNACQVKDVELKGMKEILAKSYEEIERKGPEMARIREELETAKREVINVREQLDSCTKDRNRLQRAIRDRDDRMISFERERSSLRLKCGDLTKQVQNLLLQVEIAQGKRPIEDEEMVTSSGEAEGFCTSNEFISQRLVSFKNIQDLQQQNERLLALIRELATDREEEDERAKKIKELEDELQRAKTDYEELQTAYRHGQELLNTITQQRDSLKLLTQSPSVHERAMSESTLAQAGSASNASFQNAGGVMSTPMSRPFAISRVTSSSSLVGSPNRTLNQSLNDRTLLRVEEDLAVAKRRLSERESELAVLQGEISAWKIQLSEQRAVAASAESRCAQADQRAEAARREAMAVLNKSARQDSICAQLEQTVASQRAEIDSIRQQIHVKDEEIKSVQREINQVKAANIHLVAERDSLKRAEQHTTMLLASLDAIKRTNCDEIREDKRRSIERVSELDRELVQLRIKLEEEKHRRSELIKQLEIDLGTVQKQLAAEQEAHQRTQNALSAATSTLAPDSDSAQADLERRQMTEQLAAANTDLRLELDELKRKLTLLEEEKRQKENKQNEMNSFSTSLECALMEQKSINENLSRKLRDTQQELEQRSADYEASRSKLEADLVAAEAQRDELVQRLENLQQNLNSEIVQLRENVAALTAERDGLVVEKTHWSTFITDAESKYDREVQNHAASLEQLQRARQRVVDVEKKVAAMERDKTDMASRLSAADHRVTEIEAQAEAARSEADQYRQQLDSLLAKVGSLPESGHMEISGEAAAPVLDSASADLITFLRKERALLQSRLDVAEADISRARTRITMHQREVNELRAQLNEEKKKSQVEASPSKTSLQAQNQMMSDEIQRRLETLNSVIDSNSMLRQDRDRLDAELKQLKEQKSNIEDSAATKQRLGDLQRQLDVLTAEKQAANTEVERWRKRVQGLMEQLKRSEIEELRKAAAERDTLRQELLQRGQRIGQLEQELTALKTQIESARTENSSLKSSSDTSQAELITLKGQLEKAQTTQSQLRNIAQKYKEKYLELEKQMKEKMGGALPTGEAAATSASVDSLHLQEQISNLEGQLSSTKAQLEECQRKLGDADRDKAEVGQLRLKLEEVQKKYLELQRLFSRTNTDLQETTAKLQNALDELEEAKTSRAEFERRYNDLQKQYNELHEMYEAIVRDHGDTSNKLRESLRGGSITPGGSASASAALPSSSATALPPTSGPSSLEFSPLELGSSGQTCPASSVVVSPAAVVHPRLRSQPTASVAPTNVHAPTSRLAPPAMVPPLRVWPTVHQSNSQTSAAASHEGASESTAGQATNQEQPNSPTASTAIAPGFESQPDQPGTSSGRTSAQPQKRTHKSSFGSSHVSPGEGSSVVGSSSDNLGASDSTETDANKRRRMAGQGVMPFSASEHMSEDDLLLESGGGQLQHEPTGETESEEEPQQGGQPSGDELGGEAESNQMLGDGGLAYDEGLDYESQGEEQQQQLAPQSVPVVSSEINPNLPEEEEDADLGDGGDDYLQGQQGGEMTGEFGDQVVGSSEDHSGMAEIGESGSAGGQNLGYYGGLDVHVGQSEMEEDDELSGGGEVGGEEDDGAMQPEESSSQGGFSFSGSGSFGGAPSAPQTTATSQTSESATSVPWSFGASFSSSGQQQQQQQQPSTMASHSATTQSAPSQAPRPRIEPIIWEPAPASSSSGALPGAGGPLGPSGRRLNVRAAAPPNMFFQQNTDQSGAFPPQQPQIAPQRMLRPQAQRSRGFGAAPFPRGGQRGGPRRGV